MAHGVHAELLGLLDQLAGCGWSRRAGCSGCAGAGGRTCGRPSVASRRGEQMNNASAVVVIPRRHGRRKVNRCGCRNAAGAVIRNEPFREGAIVVKSEQRGVSLVLTFPSRGEVAGVRSSPAGGGEGERRRADYHFRGPCARLDSHCFTPHPPRSQSLPRRPPPQGGGQRQKSRRSPASFEWCCRCSSRSALRGAPSRNRRSFFRRSRSSACGSVARRRWSIDRTASSPPSSSQSARRTGRTPAPRLRTAGPGGRRGASERQTSRRGEGRPAPLRRRDADRRRVKDARGEVPRPGAHRDGDRAEAEGAPRADLPRGDAGSNK